MRKNTVATSGISKQQSAKRLPKILPYPKLLPFTTTAIQNVYSFIQPHYGYSGLAVLVHRNKEIDETHILFGDWNGTSVDLEDSSDKLVPVANVFLQYHAKTLLNAMRLANVPQAQFFITISTELILQDVQLSLNRFAGPGLIKDLFGRLMRTPEIRKTEVLTDVVMAAIEKGEGSYIGDLVIKPSKFRQYHNGKTFVPLYVEVKR